MVDYPAHYRWSSYRYNASGQATRYLSSHPLYMALGKEEKTSQANYWSLFRAALDNEAISDIRLALNQNRLPGTSRFYAKIEVMTSQRQEPKPRGRPGKQPDESPVHGTGQAELPI